MAIEFEVIELDKVDEEIRSAYIEKEGKFILDPEKYYEVRAQGLLKKNRELIEDKKRLTEEKNTLDKKTRSADSDLEKQLSERDVRIAELEKSNREHAIWSPVKGLAVKSGVMGDRLEAVMTLLRAEQRFDLEDGKLVYKDKNGYVTGIKPDRAFEVYLREELPWAFEASKAAGSGAQNGRGGAGPRSISRDTFEGWTQAQRDKAIAEGVRVLDN